MAVFGPSPLVVAQPEDVIVLAGPPGCGKSTLRRGLANVVSLDDCRKIVNGDASDQSNFPQVLDLFRQQRQLFIQKMEGWINDGTNLKKADRADDLALAKQYHRKAILLISVERSLEELVLRDADPARGRQVGREVLARFVQRRASVDLQLLAEEGWDEIHLFDDQTRLVIGSQAEQVDHKMAWIADPHGCAATAIPAMEALREQGYLIGIVGDLTDKGGVRATGPYGTGIPSDSGAVQLLRYAMSLSEKREGLFVLGNHCFKLLRFARCLVRHTSDRGCSYPAALDALLSESAPSGTPKAGFGLAQTLRDIVVQADVETFVPSLIEFLSAVPTHLVFDTYVVAHAGMDVRKLGQPLKATKDAMFMRGDFRWEEPAVRPDGKPGRKLLHGHVIQHGGPSRRRTPHPSGPQAEVIALDTGCYEGGGLTAYLTDTDRTVTFPTLPQDLCPKDELEEMNQKVLELFG